MATEYGCSVGESLRPDRTLRRLKDNGAVGSRVLADSIAQGLLGILGLLRLFGLFGLLGLLGFLGLLGLLGLGHVH